MSLINYDLKRIENDMESRKFELSIDLLQEEKESSDYDASI